jgi:hypothetical protein
MIEETNLEKYYYYTEVRLKPFEALSQAELDELELSEGFKRYLRMKIWNYVILFVIIPALIIMGAYLTNL